MGEKQRRNQEDTASVSLDGIATHHSRAQRYLEICVISQTLMSKALSIITNVIKTLIVSWLREKNNSNLSSCPCLIKTPQCPAVLMRNLF